MSLRLLHEYVFSTDLIFCISLGDKFDFLQYTQVCLQLPCKSFILEQLFMIARFKSTYLVMQCGEMYSVFLWSEFQLSIFNEIANMHSILFKDLL